MFIQRCMHRSRLTRQRRYGRMTMDITEAQLGWILTRMLLLGLVLAYPSIMNIALLCELHRFLRCQTVAKQLAQSPVHSARPP